MHPDFMMCDGVCSSSCIEKYECANERIPRRHALATSHWQRYVSDHNTVAKYRPCSSTFLGIVHFAHCPKFLTGQGCLRRKIFPARSTVVETCYRHGASAFLLSSTFTFRIRLFCFYMKMFECDVHFAHCPKFLAGQGHLRRKIFPARIR